MEYFDLVVEREDAEKRLDVFISESFDDLTRNAVQKLIEAENIKVNEKVKKSNYKIKNGDFITIAIPEAEPVSIVPEDIKLDILYEDKDLIVINKPQGMVVHPAPGHYSGTVVNALLFHCAGELSGINGVLRPGIVHRIDKDTSGVIVAAKTNTAHQSLASQLASHTITRKYNAVVFNKVKNEEGIVDRPIGRNPNDRKKMAVVEKNGKRAVTHYRVIEHLGKYTHIEAQLETGRTHQIRVHMAYIGHPLVGDMVYGTKKQPVNLSGQALHARVLGFIHPVSGKYMEFEARLPEYFEKLIQKLKSL